ncbi:activator of 90 kDa heat shock protein ATPase homolog 2 isoform X2 [Stomoxys calcitrans]|uniref:activator of 90 kDa heat shock protein ATPase homolog 2 isoform X2 n=1 Tax=Stomoxys calcitrans TaxID=35570 RepID=UPI0027E32FC8|nr:activator of 90 kDa heat shock protein ATPase homolog 2 isoform X2 [Stomoxys calcitrans]
MAKWGEGDPRWIVEERPDATNVNNWHWTEKNATTWSKERFHQLFKNVKICGENVDCTIECLEKCSGEATANNRKGKLIFFYEWVLTLNWNGKLDSKSNVCHKGKILIPNLSEENELHDVEITVTIDESNEESEALKQYMYNYGREKVRQILCVYIKELKEEYSKNLILPNKNSTKDENIAAATSKNDNNYVYCSKSLNSAPNSLGCKLDVRTLSIEEEFQCSANDLYNVLTKSDMVMSFTRSPAKVEAVRGGEFQLYGGNVHGIFDELQPEKKLTLRWRLKSWPSGHFSNVSIEFNELIPRYLFYRHPYFCFQSQYSHQHISHHSHN